MNKVIQNPIADVFKYLAISILFCFLGYGFGVAFVPESVAMIANIIVVVMVVALLILCLVSRKGIIPDRFSMNWVYLFTFIDGIILYPIIQMYVGSLGKEIVISVLFITALIFLVLSTIARREKSDKYLKLGNTLFIGLIILIPFTIIASFIGFGAFNITVTVFSIIIFSGYILYDVSLVKYEIENGNINDSKDLSIHVLNLYLDFINIFLDILNLIYDFKE
ncbi:MAG: US12 family protein [Paraclostridium bifermentans]|uniref:Bax inhibitor-1/YccA family protein n=1 Tax=Paraclostridium bifermentans TaxID=1490 RepID=UPI0011DE17C2|nr:Bax inhibitor-1 family protein [Paraclostridium bifermentans]MBS6509086.1 US12 family protein [Paraclostridium bifermentans]MDU3803429.1 Bax inhibitor-1 family protein [Paraclostridium bifermentans]